jgi:hypothetical protein
LFWWHGLDEAQAVLHVGDEVNLGPVGHLPLPL